MRVAFQGIAGAYSEEAGFGYFEAPQMVPEELFEAVFAAVVSGECQSGLIAIENSLAGSIHQNYDLLLRHELHIVGEYFLRVQHCLIGIPGVDITEIQRVISHPQALGQCAGYLRKLGVKTEPVYDTAGSVKMLKESGERTTAAIASKTGGGDLRDADLAGEHRGQPGELHTFSGNQEGTGDARRRSQDIYSFYPEEHTWCAFQSPECIRPA